MNPYLKTIQDLLQQNNLLNEQDKAALLKSLTEADKQWTITDFKLDRTEKVKKTTAILLEETIAELEQKRKSVEAQNRELEIEASLERVRASAMAMNSSEDLGQLVAILFDELIKLDLVLARCIIWIFDPATLSAKMWMANSEDRTIAHSYFVKKLDHPYYDAIIKGWKERNPKWVYDLQGSEKKSIDEMLMTETELATLPESVKKGILSSQHTIVAGSFNNFGLIEASGPEAATQEQLEILYRFGKVFDLTYTRFLDLKQAEAQAREAQIEAALERVRSKTMAMHNSNDVGETVAAMFNELQKLGIEVLRCGIGIMLEDYRMEAWTARSDADGRAGLVIGRLDMTKHPLLQGAYNGWKMKKESFSYHLKDQDVVAYYTAINSDPDYPIKYDITSLPSEIYHNDLYFTEGTLYVFSREQLSAETTKIFKRFAAVFGQTYRRYLDLQKAEAQAREAKIEAALERVRSRTMAMHKSEELLEVIITVSEQLEHLQFRFHNVSFVINNKDYDLDYWLASPGQSHPFRIHVPYLDNPVITRFRDARNKGISFYADVLTEEENLHWIKHMLENSVLKNIPDSDKQYLMSRQGFARSVVLTNHITLVIGNYASAPYSDEQNAILKRFANVFEQSYTRFLDLQKAEAQAREAQIQLALERVRARTMAMHNSEDVTSATETMFEELKKLGIDNFRFGIANIHHNKTFDVFGVTNLAGGNTMRGFSLFGMDEHPIWQRWFESWKNKEEVFIAYIAGQEKEKYFNNINNHLNYLPQKIVDFPDNYFQAYYFEQGSVFAYSLLQHSEPEKEIMKRFATGFSLTFRRYQDLKKAEAQARQAMIEAVMEKVRARAMAMQKPDELIEVAELLRKEMGLLGVEELETSSIYIHNETTEKTECWYAIQDQQEKKLVADHMAIDLHDTSVGRQMLEFYNSNQKQISIPMKGLARKEWINYCADHSKAFVGFYGNTIPDRTYHLYKFSNGYMGAASPGDISKESWDLLQRATSVFSLAYTRFNDLQIAEASSKEAIKQAALDRIRADIASMRTVSDLDRITPLIWNELNILGIPFIRCGVFIMDETQQLIHTFLSTPDGKAIAAFHLPYDTPGNLSKILSHWKENKNYIDHWDESAFTELAAILVKQGAIASPGQYLDSIPHGGFYLHCLPFLQGMLYAGNTTQLEDEEIRLLQSVANAFSTAYARYEDFNKLEAAKQQVEKTLVDLKQAQQQLVQSEKMASLGELTAGIAHEIQNPLNFVNNFSEVNKELVDELQQELKAGKIDDAITISNDIKANEEKINHHGKRADAIVKGMLQHSRSSSAVKEPTDINKLADEYLRLAYHGLRAKDKSFNATLKTDFDETIGKINIIPQDIGRVILNLITNAFYVVAEKKKQQPDGYEPTVIVRTSKIPPSGGGGALISVRDNGPGIPQKILDKIFQPFFTTKPTGQGTGLGLSLAYDIVKAHGGELKVETKEGEGAEFIIHLPL